MSAVAMKKLWDSWILLLHLFPPLDPRLHSWLAMGLVFVTLIVTHFGGLDVACFSLASILFSVWIIALLLRFP